MEEPRMAGFSPGAVVRALGLYLGGPGSTPTECMSQLQNMITGELRPFVMKFGHHGGVVYWFTCSGNCILGRWTMNSEAG